ncbi:MAG: hypothetical protein HFG91_00410 [Acholeplasmatales bacterium]|nr:hypothetical protein [Acholeplasmatales bacterium]
MKVRITGAPKEVQELAELLPAVMKVSSVSGEYPNRGSNDVRVYVDGIIEKNPFTQTMQHYAEFKEDKMAMMLVAVNSNGQVAEAAAATSNTAYLILMNYFINEKFQQSIMENIKKFAEAAGINLDEVVEEGDK